MPEQRYTMTSESVTEGHPDKICDQISDAILDAILAKETQLETEGYVSPTGEAARVAAVRCACETTVTTGTVVVMGEIRTAAYVDVERIVRSTISRIGYTQSDYGFDAKTCGVLNLIHEQSPDIARGVDGSDRSSAAARDPYELLGAGDQGMMWGYATDETPDLMPMPVWLAHKLAYRLAKARKRGVLGYLRPDGKTQVSVVYEKGRPVAVRSVLVSAQHDESLGSMSTLAADLTAEVISPVLAQSGLPWADAKIFVNPTGRFVLGGPAADTGLTGRKIIVDTYGGAARHGGGAFSGKDATKVDRSGAYAARWIAKNVVAAGLASRCELQISYGIGMTRPLSLYVDTKGTGVVADSRIEAAIAEIFDLRPGAIIDELGLLRPIFEKTACYGHFGRSDPDFWWERCDRTQALTAALPCKHPKIRRVVSG